MIGSVKHKLTHLKIKIKKKFDRDHKHAKNKLDG